MCVAIIVQTNLEAFFWVQHAFFPAPPNMSDFKDKHYTGNVVPEFLSERNQENKFQNIILIMQPHTILQSMICKVAFTYKIRKSAQWHILEHSATVSHSPQVRVYHSTSVLRMYSIPCCKLSFNPSTQISTSKNHITINHSEMAE